VSSPRRSSIFPTWASSTIWRSEDACSQAASGIEVDFIVGDMSVAIEAKATARVTADHLKGLRHLRQDHPRVRALLVCLEPRRRVTADGIEIMPVSAFVRAVAEGLA